MRVRNCPSTFSRIYWRMCGLPTERSTFWIIVVVKACNFSSFLVVKNHFFSVDFGRVWRITNHRNSCTVWPRWTEHRLSELPPKRTKTSYNQIPPSASTFSGTKLYFCVFPSFIWNTKITSVFPSSPALPTHLIPTNLEPIFRPYFRSDFASRSEAPNFVFNSNTSFVESPIRIRGADLIRNIKLKQLP